MTGPTPAAEGAAGSLDRDVEVHAARQDRLPSPGPGLGDDGAGI
jgi:hypothetical protein